MLKKGWYANDLDSLLVSTSYPYGESPSVQIAHLIGAEKVLLSRQCHDYYAACSGVLMAFCDLYDQRDSIKDGEKIAIVASEQYSPTVDRKGDINRFVFGDGSSAILFEKGKDLEIICCKSRILEDKLGLIKMPILKLPYPTQTRCTLPIPVSESGYVEMDKCILDWLKKEDDPKIELAHPIDLADEMLKESGLNFSGIDVLICHQPSGPALDALEGFAKEKGFRGKFIRTVQNYGNTSSDAILRAWHIADLEEPFVKGTKVCLVGFGAGLAVASALLEIK